MTYEPMRVEEKVRLARVVIDMRRALMVGAPAPVVSAMWARHRAPAPGDWVMETSTIHHLLRATDDARWDGQFTRYLRSEMRHHEDGWSEEALICENPDGTEFAWTNADLVVVPLTAPLAPD